MTGPGESKSSLPPASRLRRLPGLWPWLLVILPPLLIAWLFQRYLLNVPFMDDYVWLPVYEKIIAGKMTLRDCFMVQMEHRITIPTMIIWALHYLAHADFKAQNWVSFGEMVLTLGNIAFLLWKTMPARGWRMALIVLAAWTVFSPVQCYTMLWSICMISFQPALFLSTALAVFQSGLRPVTKFVCCALAALAGTHCFASGIQTWLLLLPLIFWSSALPDGRARRHFAIAWLVAFAVTMGFYFHHLVNDVDPGFAYMQGKEETAGGHTAAFFANPARSLRFVILFIGSFLGRGGFAGIMDSSVVMGSLLLMFLILGAVAALRLRRERNFLSALLPWICFGLYSLGTGTMVGLGRLWAEKTLWGALWNRYTTHAVPLTFSAVVIGVMVFRRWHAGPAEAPGAENPDGPADRKMTEARASQRSKTATRLGVSAVAAVGTVVGFGWLYGADQMDAWYSSRLRDATCQLFAALPPSPAIPTPLMNTNSYAAAMDKLKLMRPALLKDFSLDRFRRFSATLKDNTAYLESCEPIGSGDFLATGYALLPGRGRVADGILLTWRTHDGKETVFALGHTSAQPLFLSDILYSDMQYIHQPSGNARQAYSHFEIRFPASALPAGVQLVHAWAFDFKRQEILRMLGDYRLDTTAHQSSELPPDTAFGKK